MAGYCEKKMCTVKKKWMATTAGKKTEGSEGNMNSEHLVIFSRDHLMHVFLKLGG